MPDPLHIQIAWRLRTSWQALPLLRRAARHAANAEGFHAGRLSIAVVGVRAMATLHQRYLGLHGPTDVLSFDLGCDHKEGSLDGEIIVCADVARRNAARPTLTAARAELALYVVHGVLHLAGYDDHAPRDFARIHAREDELLQELGLGPVFERGRQSSRAGRRPTRW